MIDLGYFKKRLLEQRNEIEAAEESTEEAAQCVTLDQSRVGRLSRMDALQAQAMAQETQRRNKKHLQQIAAALNRIDDQSFGYCLECDEEINIKRLEFDPSTPYCIECADAKS